VSSATALVRTLHCL